MDPFIISMVIFTFFPVVMFTIFREREIAPWKTLIPFYNYFLWLKLIEKPIWWYILLLIPFFNVFMVFLMIVETVKAYKKYDVLWQAIALFFPYIYLPYLGASQYDVWIEPSKRPKIKKGFGREWFDAIVFAVVAATIIRMFLFEAYTIPTSSMEKSLLVGDYLFVSKLSYGPKIPNTPLAFPFVHHTMPFSKFTKSYLEWIKLPYYRFPGFGNVERNDAVVFNYPSGDTVVLERQTEDYYRIVRDAEREFKERYGENYFVGMGRNAVWKTYQVTDRPVDKRENYIKRCVALPGDTLLIKEQQVYINNKKGFIPQNMQYNYHIETDGASLSDHTLRKFGISDEDISMYRSYNIIPLTEEKFKGIKAIPMVKNIARTHIPGNVWDPNIFPFNENYPWNVDNFGPLFIPSKGSVTKLNLIILPLYERIITKYEGNTLEVKSGVIYISGNAVTEYTFQQDYYWLMGDNRHNSADSRFWGFVPNDHIVGKAVFVWLSLDKDKGIADGKIRWSKVFRTVRSE
ncbi:MAG: signal peptidase I [Bacteroidales bacterium]|nr:signal peptidase I [Bacteroidales bacterium]